MKKSSSLLAAAAMAAMSMPALTSAWDMALLDTKIGKDAPGRIRGKGSFKQNKRKSQKGRK